MTMNERAAASRGHRFNIVHVTATNADLLGNVAPEVFDGPIDPERLRRYTAAPQQLLIIAVHNDVVVGQVAGALLHHPDEPSELFIDNLGVTPALWRQGVATALLEAAGNYGRLHGAEILWVATEESNDIAETFYASIGTEAANAKVHQKKI